MSLENTNIVTPVDSSKYAAPMVVCKRNGKIRISADYSTGLNLAVEANQYPLPTPEEILSDCHNSIIISDLDLSIMTTVKNFLLSPLTRVFIDSNV